jgi:hypothetical protein
MREKSLILGLIVLAACAVAQEPKSYLSGKLLEMNSVPCGNATKSAESTKASSLCQEYVLETDEVTYRIASRKTKHPSLLSVGEDLRFRLQNGKMHVRVPALDGKEREYMVLSMTPRGERAADAAPLHLNHLQ